MTVPTVSILIPCYNAARTVAAAIESALGQSHPAIEVLVWDDGSTDNSGAVIAGYRHDRRFRDCHQSNRGGNYARNRLLEQAQGDYVQWLDADDVLYPDKISHQLALFKDDIDMVYCDYLTGIDPPGDHRVRLPAPDNDLLTYFIRTSMTTASPLHRRRTLIAAGGFDESLTCCQEYDLHLRLAADHWQRIDRVDQPLFWKRTVPGSVSSHEDRVYATWSGLLIALDRFLDDRQQHTAARRQALAEMLYICGRHLVREQLPEPARTAFAASREIAPDSRRPVSLPLRWLTRLIGPIAAEQLVHTLRSRLHTQKFSDCDR